MKAIAARRCFLPPLTLGLMACTSELWEVGETATLPAEARADGGRPEAGLGCPTSSPRLTPEPPGPLAPQHLGTWAAPIEGAEANKFPSSRVELEIGENRRRLAFPTTDALPAATDPASGYLCSDPNHGGCATTSDFVGGFDYTLHSLVSEGSLLRFSVALNEPWDSWCQLQSPIEQPSAPGCASRYSVEAAYDATRLVDPCAVQRSERWVNMDCARLATVERRPCQCDAESCRSSLEPRLGIGVRLLEDGALEGAIWFDGDHALALRFSPAD